jgi:hypothetical protein
MNEDLGVDLDEIGRVIDEAEVFIVRFGKIESRLLVDARSAPGDPPRIEVVPPVNSASERYRYLQQSRPGLSLPDQITVFTWPRPVDLMRETGVWQRITDRLVALGGPGLAGECDRVFRQVAARERAELAAAILGGEGFETIWERQPR